MPISSANGSRLSRSLAAGSTGIEIVTSAAYPDGDKLITGPSKALPGQPRRMESQHDTAHEVGHRGSRRRPDPAVGTAVVDWVRAHRARHRGSGGRLAVAG